jgi:hypothetical protein
MIHNRFGYFKINHIICLSYCKMAAMLQPKGTVKCIMILKYCKTPAAKLIIFFVLC